MAQNLGILPRAILEFEDERAANMEPPEIEDIEFKDNALSSSIPGLDAIADAAASAVSAAADAAKALGLGNTGYHKGRDGASYLRYEVLFNPKEISISGRGTGLALMYDKTNAGQLQYQTRKSMVEMSIPLVVDKTIASKISMGVEIPGVNASISSAAKSLISLGADGSIQHDVEVFIALLRNNWTKRVVFYWGDLVFDGVLASASSTYQIFDPNGNPTRATIDLHMILASADFPTVLTDGKKEGYWKKYYDEAFGDYSIKKGSGVTSAVSNVLNL